MVICAAGVLSLVPFMFVHNLTSIYLGKQFSEGSVLALSEASSVPDKCC